MLRRAEHTMGLPMPTRARRTCPRCGTLYTKRCPTCAERWRVKSQLRRDGNPYAASAEWREASKSYLARHPYCECDDHVGLPEWLRPHAKVVDHRDGQGLAGPLAFVESNFCAMTIPCHARKTALHDGGYGRPRSPR